MNQGIAQYAAWLPESGVKELFAEGIPTIAGAFHPPATARRVDGGWRVTGQVAFGRALVHSLDRIRNDFSLGPLCDHPLATDGFRASSRQHPVQNRHTNSSLSLLSSEAAGA
jgi:hypothetical protein